MYGGGDGGGTTTQFGGGGWVPSQAAGGSAQKPNAGAAGSKMSLRALTAKQISMALLEGDRSAEGITLDGQPVHTFTVVGRIKRVDEQSLIRQYHIYDGTGTISVKSWKENEADSTSAEAAQQAELREGVYVRANGHLTRGDAGANVFMVRPITDHNEVTYHFLQCIFQHLHLAKDSAPGSVPGAAAPQVGGYQPAAPMGGAVPAGGGFGGDSGMNPNQRAVLDLMLSMPENNTDTGCNINQVAAASSGRYSPAAVRALIAELSDMGHLYSTVDDDHYKIAA